MEADRPPPPRPRRLRARWFRLPALPSPIGGHLCGNPLRLTAAAVAGVGAVAADLALAGARADETWRWAAAAAALVTQVAMARGEPASVGLTLRPLPAGGYWVRAALWSGAAVAACSCAFLAATVALGRSVALVTTPPDRLGDALLAACVAAPLLEETVYRLAFCVPLCVLLRPWGAVAASGAVFALLHLVYGNAGPENQVGGFILAWAFLRSGTITVPVALHGAGNLLAVASQVAAWEWTAEG